MYETLHDISVEKVILFTKDYTRTQLIHFLKQEFGSNYPVIAEQILLHNKAKQKLPIWTEAGCFFTSKSLEQASSQPLAAFKASLLSGKKMLDLSGGLGVDDVAFSKAFQQVISVDPDAALNQLLAFNLPKLNINNVTRVTTTGEYYLNAHPENVDAIYVDADRRSISGAKSALLSHATPDVIALMPSMLATAKVVMLKLSPLIDITYLFKTFANIKCIYVVGIKNEVKEILVVLYQGL
jgi:tRNA/tmRNA/rRNA uracil-C5-methylase (TrmA/RlmC/RlmD family)